MLSVAVGYRGVSKSAQVCVVKLPQTDPSASELAWLAEQEPPVPFFNEIRVVGVHDGLMKGLASVIADGMQRKSVFILATENPNWDDMPLADPRTPGVPLNGLFNALLQLVNEGAVIVISSGNEGRTKPVITSAYALWNTLLPTIVVGAVDNYGTPQDFTQRLPNQYWPGGSRVDVWAPGLNVAVVTGNPPGVRNSIGTSPGKCSEL